MDRTHDKNNSDCKVFHSTGTNRIYSCGALKWILLGEFACVLIRVGKFYDRLSMVCGLGKPMVWLSPCPVAADLEETINVILSSNEATSNLRVSFRKMGRCQH